MTASRGPTQVFTSLTLCLNYEHVSFIERKENTGIEKIPYMKTANHVRQFKTYIEISSCVCGAKAVKNGSAKYLFCLKLKSYLDLVLQGHISCWVHVLVVLDLRYDHQSLKLD